MATTLYPQSAPGADPVGTGNNDAKLNGSGSGWFHIANLGTARGTGVGNENIATVAGPTSGIEVAGSLPYAWISLPLAAQVTIAGSITFNLRASESSLSANVAINAVLDVLDGVTGQTITTIHKTTQTIELTTTEAAVNFAETPAAGVVCKKGDRLRVRFFGDDAGTMASGFTFSLWYGGTSAGASGDTYLTLTENLTFASEPAGTQLFLTDTASAVSTASVDREAWTSRGAGVQTDVTNAVTGWTTPIQVTDTAGGTVVDWFTRPLTGFTLAGAVRVQLRGLNSTGGAGGFRAELAVVNGDGTGAVVWAAINENASLGITEQTAAFLISAADKVVTDGQRLRIRIYIDDSSAGGPLVTGRTMTLFYAGAAAGSGDTFVTLPQTVTEFVNPPAPTSVMFIGSYL